MCRCTDRLHFSEVMNSLAAEHNRWQLDMEVPFRTIPDRIPCCSTSQRCSRRASLSDVSLRQTKRHMLFGPDWIRNIWHIVRNAKLRARVGEMVTKFRSKINCTVNKPSMPQSCTRRVWIRQPLVSVTASTA